MLERKHAKGREEKETESSGEEMCGEENVERGE